MYDIKILHNCTVVTGTEYIDMVYIFQRGDNGQLQGFEVKGDNDDGWELRAFTRRELILNGNECELLNGEEKLELANILELKSKESAELARITEQQERKTLERLKAKYEKEA
jgi:hypothetical protein